MLMMFSLQQQVGHRVPCVQLLFVVLNVWQNYRRLAMQKQAVHSKLIPDDPV
jgi:hypothetical protein